MTKKLSSMQVKPRLAPQITDVLGAKVLRTTVNWWSRPHQVHEDAAGSTITIDPESVTDTLVAAISGVVGFEPNIRRAPDGTAAYRWANGIQVVDYTRRPNQPTSDRKVLFVPHQRNETVKIGDSNKTTAGLKHEQLAEADSWWGGLSPAQQKDYISKHPNSKYAKKPSGKIKKGDLGDHFARGDNKKLADKKKVKTDPRAGKPVFDKKSRQDVKNAEYEALLTKRIAALTPIANGTKKGGVVSQDRAKQLIKKFTRLLGRPRGAAASVNPGNVFDDSRKPITNDKPKREKLERTTSKDEEDAAMKRRKLKAPKPKKRMPAGEKSFRAKINRLNRAATRLANKRYKNKNRAELHRRSTLRQARKSRGDRRIATQRRKK